MKASSSDESSRLQVVLAIGRFLTVRGALEREESLSDIAHLVSAQIGERTEALKYR